MKQTKSDYSLITGGSEGIGKQMAFELAKRGNNILLIARNEAQLKSVAESIATEYDVQVNYLPIDLSLPQAPKHVLDWVTESGYGISILINNAGYGIWGAFEEELLEDQLNMMQLNMMAVVSLVHLMLPLLNKHRSAYILNVASMGAFIAVDRFSIYTACKSFVLMLSRGWQIELKDTNISVTCLLPGAVNTRFLARAKMLPKHQKMTERFGMRPEDIARIAIKAMYRKRKEVIPGFATQLMVFFIKILPKSWLTPISSSIYSN